MFPKILCVHRVALIAPAPTWVRTSVLLSAMTLICKTTRAKWQTVSKLMDQHVHIAYAIDARSTNGPAHALLKVTHLSCGGYETPFWTLLSVALVTPARPACSPDQKHSSHSALQRSYHLSGRCMSKFQQASAARNAGHNEHRCEPPTCQELIRLLASTEAGLICSRESGSCHPRWRPCPSPGSGSPALERS